MKVLNLSPQLKDSFSHRFWTQGLSLPIELATTQMPAKFWWSDHKEFAGAIVSEEANESTLSALKEIPLEVLESGYLDHVVLENGHWWARNAFSKALKELIVARAHEVETSKFAYVVGNNFRAISAVMVLIKLGFKFFKTTLDEDFFEILERHSKRTFGIQIFNLPQKELLTQPSDGSLLVSTTDPELEPLAFEDICYFNFLSTKSVVVDAQTNFKINKLTTEGEAVGHKIISSLDVQGLTDFNILRNFKLMNESTWENYLCSWKNFVNSQSSS
jgi:hypothetical protein